jgi:lipooligosaccharide transport system permease protein
MFLFSGTFFPLSTYPEWLQLLVKAMPLWHGIELERALMLGNFSTDLLGHIGYFMVMIVIGLIFTTRRLNKVFMS